MTNSHTATVLTSGSLAMVVTMPEGRQGATLTNPPKVFALSYDLEQDCFRADLINWRAAEVLAPADMAALAPGLERLRRESMAAEMAAKYPRAVINGGQG